MLSQAEIDALPTILDVVERLSKMENDSLLRHRATIFPGDAFQDEGRYAFVSETWNRNVVRLMPVSATPYTYYRGQSRLYEPCVPTLFRKKGNGKMPDETDIAWQRSILTLRTANGWLLSLLRRDMIMIQIRITLWGEIMKRAMG